MSLEKKQREKMMSDCTGWLIFSRKPTETDK